MKKFLTVITAIVIVTAFAASLAACKTAPRKGFIVLPEDPHSPLGEIETHIDRAWPSKGLIKIIAVVTYFPNHDAVCLHYNSDFYEYHQFWSKEGREVFLKALEQYDADFNARALKAKDKKTRNAYGTTEGYLTWQTIKLTRRYDAGMNMELGYTFNGDSPYFAVTQKLTTYEEPYYTDKKTNSQQITMQFTRAQAQELAALFNTEQLRGSSNMKQLSEEKAVEADVY